MRLSKYTSPYLKHLFLNLLCPCKLALSMECRSKVAHQFERVGMLFSKNASACLKHLFLNLPCPLKLTLMMECRSKVAHRGER